MRTTIVTRARHGGCRLCRSIKRPGITLIVALSHAAAYAQGETGAPSNIVVSRPWTLDAIIVGALFALALFAVCRSSRRN